MQGKLLIDASELWRQPAAVDIWIMGGTSPPYPPAPPCWASAAGPLCQLICSDLSFHLPSHHISSYLPSPNSMPCLCPASLSLFPLSVSSLLLVRCSSMSPFCLRRTGVWPLTLRIRERNPGHARVKSSVRAELDLENRNYVIIDRGRNVTIVKSQTENNPPRTVPNTEIKEVRVAKNMKTTDKAKPKRFKELISDY